MATDLPSVLREISNWPSYELFRLMSAIGHSLEEAERIIFIKRHLRIGQKINYYVPEQNREVSATIIKFMRNRALVEDSETSQKWSVPYCSIDLCSVDLDAGRDRPSQKFAAAQKSTAAVQPAAPSVAVGDDVSFFDRRQQKMQGKVARLSDRSATVICQGIYRQVAYEELTKLRAMFSSGAHKNDTVRLADDLVEIADE